MGALSARWCRTSSPFRHAVRVPDIVLGESGSAVFAAPCPAMSHFRKFRWNGGIEKRFIEY